MCNKLNLFALILCIIVVCCQQNSLSKRPFYVIAHMVNSIADIHYYLEQGANAIETDVTFTSDGNPMYTFHGFPCDCFRDCNKKEKLIELLDHIRDITTPGHRNYRKSLVLLMLDLKLPKLAPNLMIASGRKLAHILNDHLFDGRSTLRVVITLGDTSFRDFIIGFKNEMQDRRRNDLSQIIGWDVVNGRLSHIEDMLRNIGVENVWQGSGLTNCVSPFHRWFRLMAALYRREGSADPYMQKVYQWTIDRPSVMKWSLRTGVDAMITNSPDRLVSMLKEAEMADKYTIATLRDDPFQRFSKNSFDKKIGSNISRFLNIDDMIVNNFDAE